MKQKYLECGKITGTHGIRGEVRVHPWCDSPEFLTKFKTLYTDKSGTSIKVSARSHKNMVIMKIDGVDTIELAERLRNTVIYIDRDDASLSDDEVFIQDIIGIEVYDADTNILLGKISDVSQTGANDVWHIEKDGKEYLIPAIDEVVISVDVDAEKAVIRPIKGIFDDEN
ncbi:MAG: 16S rRNA processing protein RimM [Clostridia bacterium]|nr:16S rRNA processing protein RimM [Clostridia bacterium]MEE1024354.1 ribosome maturation factor RimM [Acutalibacteraceae bacterium]